ncbi:pentatricopeptide repeat-containing protein [Dorcoceras hygrometricum]|uniref:Pentatricopeptide repeat-containing protein n=1 Tax=Dorcoceras hygrometricum TaxID=472368 RepID=A0A2Z7AQY3_9LAMI|nr:pentatricopeptide repeat-containing protein [Dorcoceras hygrometricum]
MAEEMDAKEAAAKANVRELCSMLSKAETIADPAVKKKRTTVWRVAPSVKAFKIVPATIETITIQMVRPFSSLDKKPAATKRKMIMEEDSDSEDVDPLKKMIKASAKTTPMSTLAPKTLAVHKPVKTTDESS